MLNIILIVVALVAVAAFVVTTLRNKRYLLKATRRINSKYSSLLSKAESENRRITVLYNNLKSHNSPTSLSDRHPALPMW